MERKDTEEFKKAKVLKKDQRNKRLIKIMKNT